jgi:NADPH:quinone reductase
VCQCLGRLVSLVNIITAYAFLKQIVEDGHRGAIATAGNSATGRALLELAHWQGIPVISIFRSDGAKADLERLDAEHSLDMREVAFEQKLEALATQLQTTAVFDRVGGPLLTQMMPILPWRSTIYCYGFMAGGGPIAIASPLLVAKNLVIRGFSNFATPTVKDSARLAEALTAITAIADHPAFKTKLGQQFRLDQIDEAMAAEGEGPSILIP